MRDCWLLDETRNITTYPEQRLLKRHPMAFPPKTSYYLIYFGSGNDLSHPCVGPVSPARPLLLFFWYVFKC